MVVVFLHWLIDVLPIHRGDASTIQHGNA
jgi:hypothetical protein